MKPDSEDLDETKPADVPFIKMREMNATAFSVLSLSTKGKSHEAVQNGKTTDHPSGNARKAWLNLKTINKPVNDLEEYNLKKSLIEVS